MSRLRSHFFANWHEADDSYCPTIGVSWFLGLEGPHNRLSEPRPPYYQILYIQVFLVKHMFQIELYYKKMPYTNYDEYLAWRRGRSV